MKAQASAILEAYLQYENATLLTAGELEQMMFGDTEGEMAQEAAYLRHLEDGGRYGWMETERQNAAEGLYC